MRAIKEWPHFWGHRVKTMKFMYDKFKDLAQDREERRRVWSSEGQLSADVQYIIPTNHACRIVTHARYIMCLRYI